MSRLSWHAARLTRLFGPAGSASLVVVLLSALAVLFVLQPLQARRMSVEARAGVAERTRPADMTPRRVGVAEQLGAFEQGFVADDLISPALGRLLSLSSKHRLRIDQAEFKLVSESGQPLQRYTMALPLRGEYRAVRRFVLEALRSQPGLALEEMSLRRADPRTPVLDAQLRFVLFVRKQGPGSTARTAPAAIDIGGDLASGPRPVAMR